MNKLIYKQSDLLLTTGDTFIETPSITIPGTSGGLLIAKLSSLGNNTEFEYYVSEMIAGFNKDDNGVLTLLTTDFRYEATSNLFLPTPSYVINSNNLRVRFNRNGFSSDTKWIVDLEIFYINN